MFLTEDVRDKRETVRLRASLVRMRTQATNKIWSFLIGVLGLALFGLSFYAGRQLLKGTSEGVKLSMWALPAGCNF